MAVRIILVPYDAGNRGVRMGSGPEHLLENGLADALTTAGIQTDVRIVELEDSNRAEVSAAFELSRLISNEISSTVAEGNFPLVLSGNCNSCVGIVAGARLRDLGIVWFDGHADFHTPETTTSGFTDCMGLSTAVGHCWRRMSARVPGYAPVPERNVVLVGTREIEPGERERLQACDVTMIRAGGRNNVDFRRRLDAALTELCGRAQAAYLHLDLDVLDPKEVGKANEFAPTGGLKTEETERAIRSVRNHVGIAAANIASYDPTMDGDGSMLRASVRLAKALVDKGTYVR